MFNFDREQVEILRLGDEVRFRRDVSYKWRGDQYCEIVKTSLQKHLPNTVKVEKYSYIYGFPNELDLIITKKEAKSVFPNCYDPKSVNVIIEVKGYGLVGKKVELEEKVKDIRDLFSKIKGKHKHIQCLYLTLQERWATRSLKATNYVELSKSILGEDFFVLRDSTTNKPFPDEWKRFVNKILASLERRV